MKTILVPTDFSDDSMGAVNYASELSKIFKSKIILFHAFHTPLITSEAPLQLPTLEELEHSVKLELAKMENKIRTKYGSDFGIECVSTIGFASDEIQKNCLENKVDLIVMGKRGAGILEEKLIGSVTTSVISDVKTPVLAVDAKLKFKAFTNIVFATDYKKSGRGTYTLLKEFAEVFRSHIYVLNVVKESDHLPDIEEAMDGIKLENMLEGTDHSFHVSENDSVLAGINKFSEKHDAGLIVMISRKHSFLHRIFSEPHTKQMAFHTTLPLLALHETN